MLHGAQRIKIRCYNMGRGDVYGLFQAFIFISRAPWNVL